MAACSSLPATNHLTLTCSPARVTVHFKAVVERFSPHDTIFALADAADLKESALSAACRLHAASGSTSSSTSSLRRRQLGEIAEDTEDTATTVSDADKPLPPLPYELARRAEQMESSTDARPQTGRTLSDQDPTASGEARPTSPTTTTTTTRPDPSDRSRSSSTTITVPLILSQNLAQGPSHSRSPSSFSGQEPGSPSSPDGFAPLSTYGGFAYSTKTKVRLGPRPTADPSRRAHASGSAQGTNEGRPVSSLPAGVRMPHRRSQTTNPAGRPGAQRSRFPVSVQTPTPRLSDMPTLSSLPPIRPNTSPHPAADDDGSGPPSPSSAHFPPTRTPEKQKLMKALQLRRRQLEEAARETIESEPDERHAPEESPAETDARPSSPHDPEERPGDAIEESERQRGEILEEREGPSDIAETAPDHFQEPREEEQEDEIEQQQEPDTAEATVSLEPDRKVALEPGVDAAPAGPAANRPDEVEATEGEQGQHTVDPTEEGHGERTVVPTEAVVGSSPSASDHSAERASTQASSVSDEADQEPSTATVTRPGSCAHDVEAIGKPEQRPSSLAASSADRTALADPKVDDDVSTEQAPSLEACDPVGDESVDPPTSQSRPVDPESDDVALTPTPNRGHQESRSSTRSPSRSSVTLDPEPTRFERQDPILVTSHASSRRAEHRDSISSCDSAHSGTESDSRPTSTNTSKAFDGPRKKRRIVMAPIRTDISTENSDDNLLSDDSLMEELNSATVQEAKPVSVGKSPMTPVFPGLSDDNRTGSFTSHRSVSSPMLGSHSTEALDRSMLGVPSGSFNTGPSPEQLRFGSIETKGPIAVIKKVNVSTGISQRIKALERVSSQASRPNSPPPSQPQQQQQTSSTTASASGSPTVSGFRKASLRSASGPAHGRNGSENNGSPVSDGRGVGAGSAVLRPLSRGPAVDDRRGLSKQQQQQQPGSSPSSVRTQMMHDARISDTQGSPSGRGHTHSSPVEDMAVTPTPDHDVACPARQPKGFLGGLKEDAVANPSSRPASGLPSPPSTRRPSIITIRSTSSREGKRTRTPPMPVESSPPRHSPQTNERIGRGENEAPQHLSSASDALGKTPSPSGKLDGASAKGLGITVQPTPERQRAATEVGDVNVQFPDNIVRRASPVDV